jgi:hypothetical protein
MTKTENREIKTIEAYHAAGMTDTAARALSALIRAASSRSRPDLMIYAHALKLTTNPEFII